MISRNNMRPGVYSSYTISTSYATPRSTKGAVLYLGLSGIFNDFKPITISSVLKANEIFGVNSEDKTALLCLRLLLQSGVTEVVVVKKTGDSDKDMKVIANLSNIGVIIADTTEAECTAVLESVISSSNNLKERICIFPALSGTSAISTAKRLNNPRAIIVYPSTKFMDTESPLFTACGLSSAILTAVRPTINFNGLDFPLLSGVKAIPEDEVQLLLKSGVTVFENTGSGAECIRGITSKTTTDDVEDYTMRSINTVLIIDEVMSSVRRGLKAKLKGSGMFSIALDSIASQTIVELAEKQREGLISSYLTPIISPSISDPSVCIVELAFNVAHVIDQIHITAHIEI